MSVSEGEKGGCLPKRRLLLSQLKNKDNDFGGSQKGIVRNSFLKGKLCQLAVEETLFCKFKSLNKIPL